MANYVFPKVDEVKPPHSKRDLSLYKQATFSVGPAYPILTIDMLPDDWMKVRTVASLESLPMLGPVRGRWKLSFDYFFEPWSNLYGYMDNNKKMSTQDIIDEHLWTVPVGGGTAVSYDNPMSFDGDIRLLDVARDFRVVGKGSLLDYLGVPVGYFGEVKKDSYGTTTISPKPYNASGLLTYLDIIRNYYTNPQEGDIPFVGIPGVADMVVSPSSYPRMSLEYLDDYFMTLRYKSRNGIMSVDDSIVPDSGDVSIDANGDRAIGFLLSSAHQRGILLEDSISTLRDFPNAGCFVRSYRMDLLRGIMNNSVGQYVSMVDTSSGSFDITTLMFANKLQTLINRIDVTGGRFTDWIRTRWGVKPGIEVDRPLYLGSHSTWLDTIDVIATASGDSGDSINENSTSNLGQQVSYGQGQLGAGDQRPVIISTNQYGTLQCIMSLVPDVVYSQGFELNTIKTKFMDLFDPAFNQLGYQDVLREELTVFPILSWNIDGKSVSVGSLSTDYSVGKRVAWSEYMASLPRAHGDFAYGESLDWWTNGRKYQTENIYPSVTNSSEVIDDLAENNTDVTRDGLSLALRTLQKCGPVDTTTYIYPHLFNGIFADQSVTALNWIISVRFDIEANRALGKRLMPHL